MGNDLAALLVDVAATEKLIAEGLSGAVDDPESIRTIAESIKDAVAGDAGLKAELQGASASDLVEALKRPTRQPLAARAEIGIWDTPWPFLVFIALCSAEWFIRRWKQLT